MFKSKKLLTVSVLAIFATSSGISTSHAQGLTLVEDAESGLKQNLLDDIDQGCDREAEKVSDVVRERDNKHPLDQVLDRGHEDFEQQRSDLSDCDTCGPSITRQEDRYSVEVRLIYEYPELGSQLLSNAVRKLCVKQETSFWHGRNQEFQKKREDSREEFQRELDEIR